MTLPRQKLREAVLQILFSFDQGVEAKDFLIRLMMAQLKAARKNIEEAYEMASAVWAKKQELDKAISGLSHAFTLARIHKTELQILRIGFYELLFVEEIPGNVAIAEAIRLARKFATPAAAIFINALMDQQKKSIEGKAVDNEELNKAFAVHEEQSQCEKKAVEEL